MAAVKAGILVASVSRIGGGGLYAVRGMAQSVFDPASVSVEVFSLEDDLTHEDLPGWHPLPVRTFRTVGPRLVCYSPHLVPALENAGLDLIHAHGAWMYPSLASLRWSRAAAKPYLVSCHGLLDPWALRQSTLKKRVAGWLFEDRHLHGARCLHAVSEAEARAYRDYGLRNPICVIPNGIELPQGPRPNPPTWRRQLPGDVKVLLYMGRLHPKKGLANLLNGWHLLRSEKKAFLNDWHLVIAGWSQLNYERHLQDLSRELMLQNSVHFIGPQFGPDKRATYSWADAFILPSLSEGLPIAVLEAWSYALPVLMTSFCNLPEGPKHSAALEIGVDPPSIRAGILALLKAPDRERAQMGERGRMLVTRQFSWPDIGSEMRKVYQWSLGGGQPPASMMTT